jgi:hypothetical protein
LHQFPGDQTRRFLEEMLRYLLPGRVISYVFLFELSV